MNKNKTVSISFSRPADSNAAGVELFGSSSDLLWGLSLIVRSMCKQGILNESAFVAVWLASFEIGPDSVPD